MSPRPIGQQYPSLFSLLAFVLAATPVACTVALGAADDARLTKVGNDAPINEGDAATDVRGSAVPTIGVGGAGASGDAGMAILRGSPLCAAPKDGTSCFPDEGAYGQSCAMDADAASSDSGREACRVRGGASADERRAPACAASGAGQDGAECIHSADCSAGFECVRSPGRCRRYCCGLTCNDAQSFCDIDKTAPTAEYPGLEVPVCSPVRNCKLLDGQCGQEQTCAVVRDDGTTSCVATGPARAGEGCEREHCAADHACLGQIGTRKCFKLCDVGDRGACPTGQTCRGSAPLFKEGSVGVCE